MPNANIDYVTSHQGTAHITTQNVIDLLAGIRGDISGVQRFPDLYNGLAHSITDVRAIQIKTGAALAGGSFFILEDAYDWLLDSGAVGYSRIDILYLVMYENLETNVQSCDFVYRKGESYLNGSTGTEPSAPTGTNITATYPIMKVVITDSAIANVTDCVEDYLSNDDLVAEVANLVEQLESDIGGTVEQVETNTEDIETLNTSLTELSYDQSRTKKQFTSLTDLASAAADQDLGKYGLSIGDYYVGDSGYYYYIADMDTFYGNYDDHSVVSTHHIGLVVDTKTTSSWYSSNNTSNGYNGSVLHSFLTGTVLTNIISDLGSSHLLPHQKYLTTSTTSYAWQESQYISALSEVQVYGSTIWSMNGYQEGECCRQLELFRKYRFNEILGDFSFWLRNIQSDSGACIASSRGYARYDNVTTACHVAGLILFY